MMGRTPLVSIIMPVFNVEPYIGQAVRSIMDQTWHAFELIVIDDGSTDRSIEILRKICGNDSRVRILTQSNRGLSAARNLGLQNAVGQFVYFFDSDDVLDIDALSQCMLEIIAKNLDLIAFSGSLLADTRVDSSHGNRFRKPDLLQPSTGAILLAQLESIGAYSPSACLYIFSRSLVGREKLVFDEGFLHEDEGFTPLLFCLANRAISLKAQLFLRRIRADSITTTQLTSRNIEGWLQASRKIDEFVHAHPDLPTAARRTLRRLQRILLRSALVRSERHALHMDFKNILRQRFTLRELAQVDVAVATYVLLCPLINFLRQFRR